MRAKVEIRLAQAIEPHEWLADLLYHGIAPDLATVGLDGAVKAIFSTLGGIIVALDDLAGAIDRLTAEKGETHDPS